MTTRASDNGAVRNDPPVSNDFGLVVRPLITSPIPVDVEPEPSTSTGPVSIAASLAVVTLLAANPTRVGFSIRNSSTDGTLYVFAGTGAGPVSAALHTVALVPGAYYEDPYDYVDAVTGIWVGGTTGAALVTEYIPVP